MLCREAGARVGTNILVRDLDLVPTVADSRWLLTDFRCFT